MGVVVPVRTPAPFLGDTLDSILAQSPPPARVVVVDDGSPQRLELSPAHQAGCELLRAEPGGPALARSAGIRRLDTELVALCDADDVWAPGSLALRVRALAAAPTAAVCFGRAVIVGADDKPTGERWQTLEPGLHAGPEVARLLFERNPIPTSSVVVRRSAVADHLDSRLRWAEDWDLWLRLAARGEGFVYEPEAVVYYRRHPAALTAQVGQLARAQLELHEQHGQLVDDDTRRRVRARDLRALASGLLREGNYAEADRALASAAALGPLPVRDRARRLALRWPLIRRRLGRRDPYR